MIRTESARHFQLRVSRHDEPAWSLSGQHTGRTDLPPNGITVRARSPAQASDRARTLRVDIS
ncbi:MAG: hypothetical protein C5B58_11990 [Acidobacteria bacterium]|nr:MAG: hypothetical protein C5B58_11990 [Acidobacteriota bacterium]